VTRARYSGVLVTAGLLLLAAFVQDSQATSDTSTRAKLIVLPVVSYSEVTGVQYGATVFRSFRTGTVASTRGSSYSAYASRTARNHGKAYVQLDQWQPGNDAHARLRAEYISYPLPYFGIGADTPDSAEQWYSSGVTTVQAFGERRLRGPTYLHAGVRVVGSHVREVDSALSSADTPVPAPRNSTLFIYTLGVMVDSRDRTGSPSSGSHVRVLPSASWLGGTPAILKRLTIDARHYLPVGRSSVAAFQVQYDGAPGNVPFDHLPMIGADSAMRGYARGRYRDHHAVTAQAELRSGYWRRVGTVAFAGGGTVAPRFSRLAGGSWFPTVGAGLRYVLSPRERNVVRLDFGIGKGTKGISVGIGEAF
jgi:outer membrane protein assembly factor BamA